MREDLKAELLRVQEQAIDDAVENADLGHMQDQDSKEGRGDRVWNYKSANQCMTFALQVERLLAAQRAELPGDAGGHDDEQTAKNLIAKAEAAAKRRLEAARSK